MLTKRQRPMAAYIRFLRERRFTPWSAIAGRLNLDEEQVEGVYDEAVAQGIKPEDRK